MPEIGEIRRNTEIGYKGKGNYIWHACEQCGKQRWIRLRRGEPWNKYCHSCALAKPATRAKISQASKRRIGDKRPNWKGGKITVSGGYIQIRLYPDDFFYSMVMSNGYVFEHRLVVAKALGRCLHRWEIVHHKGVQYPKGSKEDKADNRYPENLQLVSDDRHVQLTILENRISYLEKQIKLLKGEIRELNKERKC